MKKKVIHQLATVASSTPPVHPDPGFSQEDSKTDLSAVSHALGGTAD